jgi:hypothetical protein
MSLNVFNSDTLMPSNRILSSLFTMLSYQRKTRRRTPIACRHCH